MADFDLGGMFNNFMNALPGVGNGNLGTASVIPSLASAWNQYRDADRYEDLGREAGNLANPFSNERRNQYANRLDQYYTNPTAFLEGNPEYKAISALGLDKIKAENAAQGWNQSGKATGDQLAYLSKLAAQYLGEERDDLSRISGADFNNSPHQANMMMRGGEAAINSRNAALDALQVPFGLQTAGNRVNGGENAQGFPGFRINPNNMNGGLGSGLNSLSGLFGLSGGFGPGLSELYGPTGHEGWNYMPPGWADQVLGPIGGEYQYPSWLMDESMNGPGGWEIPTGTSTIEETQGLGGDWTSWFNPSSWSFNWGL